MPPWGKDEGCDSWNWMHLGLGTVDTLLSHFLVVFRGVIVTSIYQVVFVQFAVHQLAAQSYT